MGMFQCMIEKMRRKNEELKEDLEELTKQFASYAESQIAEEEERYKNDQRNRRLRETERNRKLKEEEEEQIRQREEVERVRRREEEQMRQRDEAERKRQLEEAERKRQGDEAAKEQVRIGTYSRSFQKRNKSS